MTFQFFDQRRGDGIKIGDDDVISRVNGKFPGRAVTGLRVHPRSEKEFDENERQKNQQKNHAGKQDDNRENPADIAGERYVSESERGHDHHGPVETGDPRMFLSFHGHDIVEQNAVEGNQRDNDDKILYQQPDVGLDNFTFNKRADYSG